LCFAILADSRHGTAFAQKIKIYIFSTLSYEKLKALKTLTKDFVKMIPRNTRCVIICSVSTLIALTLLTVIIIFGLLKLSAASTIHDVYTLIQVITGALGILFSVIGVAFYFRDRYESQKAKEAEEARQAKKAEQDECQKLLAVQQIENTVSL
jgi:cytochrome c biogenesis protein CcdA